MAWILWDLVTGLERHRFQVAVNRCTGEPAAPGMDANMSRRWDLCPPLLWRERVKSVSRVTRAPGACGCIQTCNILQCLVALRCLLVFQLACLARLQGSCPGHEPMNPVASFAGWCFKLRSRGLGLLWCDYTYLASGSAVEGGRRATDGADLPQDSGFWGMLT